MTSPETGTRAEPQAPACYRHPGRETYIRCTRCERPICPDCMRDAPVGFQCPECVSAGNAGVRRPRRVPPVRALAARGGVVTYTLVGLCVAAWLVELAAGQSLVESRFALFTLVQEPNGVIGGVARGEYYRLLTAIFLHVSWLHIALNMYLLWLLGIQLEAVLGRVRFATLFLASGLAGSALSYWMNQSGAGASGAIFGMFAAYYLYARRARADTTQIVLLIVLNLVLSFTIPGIGYWAHLGGLVGGAVIGTGYVYLPGWLGSSRRARPFVQAIGVVVVLAAVAAATGVHTAALGYG